MLSLDEIASRLDDCMDVLRHRSRGGPARHETLQAVIDWGYRLLSPAARGMLGHLSVFAGGFGLAAAQAVCSPALAGADALDVVDELVSNSFVHAEVSGPAARYRLLEPIRQYAAAKLRGAGQHTEAMDRHLAWHLALAEQLEPVAFAPGPAVALDRLGSEKDNLTAALAWSMQAAPTDAGPRLVHALYPFFYMGANYREGLAWSQQVLALPGSPTGTRAAVSRRAGNLALGIGDLAAAGRLFAGAVALGRASGDRRHLGRALCSTSGLAVARGELGSARSQLEEAITLATDTGDAIFVAEGRSKLAGLACLQGHLTEARTLAGAVIDQAGGEDWIHPEVALFVLADVAHIQGRYRLARSYVSKALALHTPLGGQNVRLTQVGLMAMAEGRPGDARTAFEAAAAAQASISDEPHIPLTAARGSLAVVEGDTAAGLALVDHAHQQAASRPHDVVHLIAVLTLHGTAHLHAGDPAGGRASLQQATVVAHRSGIRRGLPETMEALAACLAAERSLDAATQAVRLVGAAEALRHSTGAVRPPTGQRILEVALSDTAQTLRPDQTAAIRSAGNHAGADAVLNELPPATTCP